MKNIFIKTFGGLSKAYLFRQYFFATIISMFFIGFLWLIQSYDVEPIINIPLILFLIINTLLYPYARFVFDSIFNFLIGDNVLYIPMKTAMALKYAGITFCYTLAIIIAPIGLIFLYFHQTKQQKLALEAEQSLSE